MRPRTAAARRRDPWLDRIGTLDPDRDCSQVYRLHYGYQFPWDTVQALSFALFRTYAVPSIGALLDRTGEFTDRVQRRYDDTNLLLDEIVENGFDSGRGRAALRRVNAMHRAYDISDDDMRYVLATFVVVPVRWLARFGWRPLTDGELTAMVGHYRELGRHLGIRGIPRTFADFERAMDDYEVEQFGFDAGARRVADATLDLMATFAPYRFLPRPVFRRLAFALMDEPLLDAFRYPHPTRAERTLVEAGLRLRARVVALLPPRMTAYHARDQPGVRSYPDGYRIEDLGTFPPRRPSTCPVPHAG